MMDSISVLLVLMGMVGILAMLWVNGHLTLGLLQDILKELKRMNERKP